ncbi:hypothetical protein AKJ18_13920 [Vibrio xuii]|nr:hypothetical protein AKJ18_13920 [Vibrio xuii]
MTTSLNVGANLTPNKSQVVLLGFLIGGCCSLAASFYFLWHDKNIGYLPMTIGTGMTAFSGFGWIKSQKDTDLTGSPTVLEDTNKGIKITTDSRFANSSQGAQVLRDAIESTMCRRPLPQAQGMVDNNCEPIPNSQEAANEATRQLNAQAQAYADEIGSKFSNEVEVHNGVSDQLNGCNVSIDSSTIASNKPFEP